MGATWRDVGLPPSDLATLSAMLIDDARRAAMLMALVSVVALPALGCSSSGSSYAMNDGGDAATGVDGGTANGCANPREAELRGTLDGTTFDQKYVGKGSSFAGGGYDGRFGSSVYVGTPPGNVSVMIAEKALAHAGSAIVSGTLRMPREGPRPGEVFCVGGGVLARPSSAYTFTLTNLSKASVDDDAGTTCLEPIEGEISGCIRGPT
jgi:hypothetical protein